MLRKFRSSFAVAFVVALVLYIYALVSPYAFSDAFEIKVLMVLIVAGLLTLLSWINLHSLSTYFKRKSRHHKGLRRKISRKLHILFDNLAQKLSLGHYTLAPTSLFLSSIALLVLIILFEMGSFSFSIDWFFLVYVAIGITFFFSRVDSRFVILYGILLLWFCPFLLSYKLERLAEDLAVFTYYSLIIGVVLQFVEIKLNRRLIIGLEEVKHFFFSKINLFIGFFLGGVYFLSLFLFQNAFLNALTLYLSITFIIFFSLRFVLKEGKHNG
jgi:hypothetical protein